MPPSGLSPYEFASTFLWVGLLKKTTGIRLLTKRSEFLVGSNMAHKKHGPFFEGIDGPWWDDGMWWEAAAAFSFWKKTRKLHWSRFTVQTIIAGLLSWEILYGCGVQLNTTNNLVSNRLKVLTCWFAMVSPGKNPGTKTLLDPAAVLETLLDHPSQFWRFPTKNHVLSPPPRKKKSTKQVGFLFFLEKVSASNSIKWRHHWLAPKKIPHFFHHALGPGTWAPPQPGKWTFFLISSARELGTFQAFFFRRGWLRWLWCFFRNHCSVSGCFFLEITMVIASGRWLAWGKFQTKKTQRNL